MCMRNSCFALAGPPLPLSQDGGAVGRRIGSCGSAELPRRRPDRASGIRVRQANIWCPESEQLLL